LQENKDVPPDFFASFFRMKLYGGATSVAVHRSSPALAPVKITFLLFQINVLVLVLGLGLGQLGLGHHPHHCQPRGAQTAKKSPKVEAFITYCAGLKLW
jgi:hypothetical protein